MQASQTLTTKGGKRAYVYQGGGGFDLMCTGCGWTSSAVGLAPALVALRSHANRCTS